MIDIEKIRKALQGVPTRMRGGPGGRAPTEYVARQDVLSMLDKLELPEYVDLAKLYEAQKIIREAHKIILDAPEHFCDKCGATNPKHGFYPLHHSHVIYNGELMESVSSVTCNCCHATEKVPCIYCEEEKRTGEEANCPYCEEIPCPHCEEEGETDG